MLEAWFCIDCNRYPVDFRGGADWYQFDTPQDAPYFGQWINPVKLQLLSYAEGDIDLICCETVGQYEAQIAKLEQMNRDLAGDRDLNRYGLDDKDGRYLAKLEGSN